MKCLKTRLELRNFLARADPRLLSLEHRLMIILELSVTVFFAFLFGLPIVYTLVLGGLALALTPWFIAHQLAWIHEEREFFMLTDFLQQLVATFKQHPKIYASLVECADITQGRLATDVKTWTDALEDGGFPKEHARRFIEAWPHFIVGNLVHLMLAVENFGTFNYGEGLEIIQDDIEDWIEDTYRFKQSQAATRNRIQLLTLASLVIAWMSHNMLGQTSMIDGLAFYHFSIFAFLAMDLLTFYFAQKSISAPWLENQEMIWKKASS